MMSIYEFGDGKNLDRTLEGTDCPLAPEWVRERTTLPPRYAYANLSTELGDWFGEEKRSLAAQYVKQFSKRGSSSLLIRDSSWKVENELLAAGVLNEITLRFGNKTDISVEWLSVYGGLPYLMDMRDARRWDEYNAYRNNAMNAAVLWVQGLEAVQHNLDARWYVHMLYQHRYQHKLPTITTVTVGAWEELIKLFGRTFVKRLYLESEGFRIE